MEFPPLGAGPRTQVWIDIFVGGVVGAIAAVNVVICSGIDDGYEATLGEVFDQSPAVRVVAVALALLGPLAGIVVARCHRNRRTTPTPI